jgi:hypothetical protein
MAPVHVRKRGKLMRKRLVSGVNAEPSLFTACLQKDEYALIGPKTQLVCKCCFCIIDDISQHTATKSGCALFMGAKHVCYCYQENSDDGDEPDIVTICCMFLDKKCLVDVEDVIHQGDDWNPDDNFVCNAAYGHRLDPKLLKTSFTKLYEEYKKVHPELAVDVPDLFTEATQAASSVKNLNVKLMEQWKKEVRKIKRDGSAEDTMFSAEEFEISVHGEVTYQLNQLIRSKGYLSPNQVKVQVESIIKEKVDNGALVKAEDLQQKIEEYIQGEVSAGRLVEAGTGTPARGARGTGTIGGNAVTPA